VDKLPASWIPYAHLSRLEKPIGSWLLAWPCFWSIGLAAPAGTFPDLSTIALFGAGSILLRGAGCTVNDLWDRDLDGKVERTRTRPLPSGAVSPIQAVGWLGAQLGLGLGVLLQLNGYSQALGASSLALVVTYPLMKRVTGWPQAFLGLTFNWGALLGWAAVRGTCDWSVVLPLYFGGVAWTLVYDTIYAHQDKKDDALVGIKSTALTFGKDNREYLSAFVVANAVFMSAAGYAAGCGMPYYAGLAAAVTHLGWQAATVNFDDAQDCGNKFKSNTWYGALLFAGITADRVLAASETLETVTAAAAAIV
jgi:4-hydroxybenzoate polyprenyltransferase